MDSCLAINHTCLICLSGGQGRKFSCVTCRDGEGRKLNLRTASGGIVDVSVDVDVVTTQCNQTT